MPCCYWKSFAHRGRYCNLLCNHARFDYGGIRTFMPSDTIFVTILRDPGTAFESSLRYDSEVYRTCFHLISENLGKEFVENMASYYKLGKHKKMCEAWAPSRNRNIFDLGLEPSDMDDTETVLDKIREIDKIFSLVMMTEYFDESIILLKNLLNWSFEDVVYLRHNVMKKSRHSKRLSETSLEQLRLWNAADTALYTYFNASFWRRVEQFGRSRLYAEVETLRTLNARWREYCVENILTAGLMNPTDPNVPYHHDALGYQLKVGALSHKMCLQLTRPEIPYSDMIFDRMKSIGFSDKDYYLA